MARSNGVHQCFLERGCGRARDMREFPAQQLLSLPNKVGSEYDVIMALGAIIAGERDTSKWSLMAVNTGIAASRSRVRHPGGERRYCGR